MSIVASMEIIKVVKSHEIESKLAEISSFSSGVTCCCHLPVLLSILYDCFSCTQGCCRYFKK